MEFQDGTRSCVRGKGPDKQCPTLYVLKIANLQCGDQALVKRGPCFVREGYLVMAWWFMREVELGTARRRQVTLIEGKGCGCAELLLPVGKSDLMALEARRSHG